MKIKTSELTGAALDWAVAKCEGFVKVAIWTDHIGICKKHSFEDQVRWAPSTDWAQGGPIIEREQMSTNYDTDYEYDPKYKGGERWVATHANNCLAFGRGTTPLIAAMRCYVASKLGDTIDIPEELT